MNVTTPKPLSRLALLLALALPVGVASSWASAQDHEPGGERDRAERGDDESAAESRATSFRAVDGAQVEDVPGGLMLVGAYGAIAILLLAFLLRQQAQLGALAARIDSLRGEIERGREGDDAR